MSFIIYLIIGGFAGFLAGKLLKGEGFGVIFDILIGLVGGWIGGWLFSMLGITAGGGHIGEFVTAFVGAVLLVGISRLIKS
jgi:uncharacterized membrane protein YeaQ/YmgE (transglycosylase-associated protein family)